MSGRNPLKNASYAAVLGAGRSGIAAARLLLEYGHRVDILDGATVDEDALRAKVLNKMEDRSSRLTIFSNVELLNTHGPQVEADFDLVAYDAIITSPGLKPTTSIFAVAREANVEVISEIELGFRATKHPIIAISGTDGKTTTTTLIEHLIHNAPRTSERPKPVRTHACGNIGEPFCEAILAKEAWVDWWVVEVSAFQLWSCPTFAPDVLVVTNIADDHMDYFDNDAAAYAAAKLKPLEVMSATQVAVLNEEDAAISSLVQELRFARGAEMVETVWYTAERPYFASLMHSDAVVLRTDDIPLLGRHNVMNVLSAGIAASAAVPVDFGALATYQVPAHRLEPVLEAEFDGVPILFVNDSKATNPHASMAGLKALAEMAGREDRATYVIAGGVDKGLELGPWTDMLVRTTTGLAAIGELKERLIEALKSSIARARDQGHAEEWLLCETKIVPATDMADAVRVATKLACENKGKSAAATVLLTPGCSSFDMYASYADRGLRFVVEVEELAGVCVDEP